MEEVVTICALDAKLAKLLKGLAEKFDKKIDIVLTKFMAQDNETTKILTFEQGNDSGEIEEQSFTMTNQKTPRKHSFIYDDHISKHILHSMGKKKRHKNFLNNSRKKIYDFQILRDEDKSCTYDKRLKIGLSVYSSLTDTFNLVDTLIVIKRLLLSRKDIISPL